MPKETKETIYIIIATFFVLCTFPVSFSLAIMYWLFTKLFSKKKIPDSLKNFCDKTQESIVQWFENVKTNCSVSEMDEIDDYYIDPMLFIIEWNDNGLGQRNINKNNIITAIRSFGGVRPISDLLPNLGGGVITGNPSDSMFCVFDAPPIENQQIIQGIIVHLTRTYYQANQPLLGRVFDIEATVKGKFKIREHYQIF